METLLPIEDDQYKLLLPFLEQVSQSRLLEKLRELEAESCQVFLARRVDVLILVQHVGERCCQTVLTSRRSSTGSVVVTATCATTPLS